MNLVNPPVARMFRRGAPILRESGCAVAPLENHDDDRVALETYPKLVARFAIGAAPYKGRATPGSSTDGRARARNRRAILDVLQGSKPGAEGVALRARYGVTVRLATRLARDLIGQEEGDHLDAVLCAVAAGWAWLRRNDPEAPWGIPKGRAEEGWIVDPTLFP
jgi:predicted RNase H-like nuclease